MTITGEITDIKQPFKIDNDTYQVIRIKRAKNVFIYAEFFNNIELLKGLKEGDKVDIEYNLKNGYNRRITVKALELNLN